jgi:Zn-dependent membrane protease YugP
MFLDPIFILYILPGVVLATWAWMRVRSAFADGARVMASSRLSGAEAAARILAASDVPGVRIDSVEGELSDHYDPARKVLRLSPEVYSGRSLAALGIAAHEAGHAIQDARGCAGLVVRNVMVPIAGLGSSLFWLLIVAGFLLGLFQLVLAGIALFSMNVIFQLVNLPVEYDASRRARQALLGDGLIQPEEDATVGRVLDAAAMTYVAATLTSVFLLMYHLVRFALLGRPRREG